MTVRRIKLVDRQGPDGIRHPGLPAGGILTEAVAVAACVDDHQPLPHGIIHPGRSVAVGVNVDQRAVRILCQVPISALPAHEERLFDS